MASSTSSPQRALYRDTLGTLVLVTGFLLAAGMGYLIVWFATAPDDGSSIWPVWNTALPSATASPVTEPSTLQEPLLSFPTADVDLAQPPQALSLAKRVQLLNDRPPSLQPKLSSGIHNSLGMLMTPFASYADGRRVWLCVHETRLGDYSLFMDQSHYEPTGGLTKAWFEIGQSMATASSQYKQNGTGAEHPVSYISVTDARAFCSWLTREERRKGGLTKGSRYRLPTDAEWTLALDTISSKYPWGDSYPPQWQVGNLGREIRDGYAATSPIMQYAPSSTGIYDLIGNVGELCVLSSGVYVRRGSNWLTDRELELRSAYRIVVSPDERSIGTGFRCVLEEASENAL